MIKVFSMFSGIGGFELGILNSIISDDVEFIGHSEIDKYAEDVYQKHFGGKNYGDATRINTEDLPDFDFLVGGFPCQAFSVAGLRRGFDDTRGTLFFEIARILRDKRPRRFLLENVEGLLFHSKGETIQTIFQILTKMGYDISLKVYNSKDFGVPQNRKRTYIAGYLRGECGFKILSEPKEGEKGFQPINANSINIVGNHGTTNYRADDVVGIDGLSKSLRAQGARTTIDDTRRLDIVGYCSLDLNRKHQNDAVYATGGLAPTLCRTDYKDPVKIDLGEARAIKSPDRLNPRQNGRTIKDVEDPSFTLTASEVDGVTDMKRIRRLTPLECERLQAFPDEWTRYGAEMGEMSDTQRYKMCGNAVTTSVVTFVVNQMFGD